MRSVEEIYREMQEEFINRTGVACHDSGEMALRLWAFAYQIFALEAENDWLKRQCFPQTASGEYLDYHAQMRGLTRMQPMCATGKIRFYIKDPLETSLAVTAGVVCTSTGGVEFVTTTAGEIEAGALYCEVEARAVQSGTAGNVPINSIVYMMKPPIGVSSCRNVVAFTGGMEEETDQALRERILDRYQNVPSGGNANYYKALALQVPGILSASVQPRVRGRGTVDVVVCVEGGIPSADMLAAVSEKIAAEREIGVDVLVKAPQIVKVKVEIAILPASGVSFQQAKEEVAQALEHFFTGERLGRDVYKMQLARCLLGLSSIQNFSITQPTVDVPIQGGELAQLESCTVTQLGG